MRVRVVTLNLEGLDKRWFEERRAVAVEGLEAAAPDVLCLQEVTVGAHGNDVYDQAWDVARAVGLEHCVFDTYGDPDDVHTDHQDGLAIACRWPFRRLRDRRLPHAEGDPPDGRVVLLASAMAPGGDLELLTTHLAWRPGDRDTRVRQAQRILEDFTRGGWPDGGSRAVLVGDLNATEDDDVVRMLSSQLQDAWRACHPDAPGYTWVRDNPLTGDWDMPDRRLDYVFVPRGVPVRRAEVILDRPNPVYASDHFGLLVELEWGAS